MQNYVYIQNGENIFFKFCTFPDNLHPTMLPRAPDQTYIDRYPENSPDFKDERQRQFDYEAEVIVYRALEKLDEKRVIVLHNFEYTHDQYCLCDHSHSRDKKTCKGCKNSLNKEGECDFLILCPGYFVLMEVKNMCHVVPIDKEKHFKALCGTFRKSADQRKKIASLIQFIEKDAIIFQFTAYPNFSKPFRGQFQSSENKEFQLSDSELSTVIFKEDIVDFNNNNELNFSFWWKNNTTIVPETIYNPGSFEKDMLLAIWATDKKKCDQSKCSLANCILETDKRLKEGKFTFSTKKGKNRAQNPGVKKAPDVIKNYVQVENLTVEQCEAFNSTEKMLWINGPAGTWKSVILCGRMIKLVQSDEDNKVVLFKFGGDGNNCQLYQCALQKANVEYQETSTRDLTAEELVTLIISESNCKVIIVEITRYDVQKLTDTISAVTNCRLFIDDIQDLLNYCANGKLDSVTVLMDKLLLSNCSVRVACDLAQGYYFGVYGEQFIGMVRVITDKLSSSQLVTLSMNLRNTCDISNILCVIREQFRELRSDTINVSDMILPVQSPGHFIHGPLPVIHVFNDYNVNGIIRVLNIELDGLCVTDNLNYSDIGIVYNDTSDVLSLVKEDSVNRRCVNTGSKIAVCHSSDCYSAQWPAVIVLYSVLGYNLTELYLTLSRARVYCSVFIYPWEGYTLSDTPYMLRLLDKLSNFARIIRY